jgi:serine/threonine protein kinase
MVVFVVAPEVFRRDPSYNETVDVYSYAMILFYLLDGKPPWPYDNGMVTARKAADEGDRPPVPRHWDMRLQNLLQEMWHETPSNRPPFRMILKVLNEYARKFASLQEHCRVKGTRSALTIRNNFCFFLLFQAMYSIRIPKTLPNTPPCRMIRADATAS